MRKNIRDSFFSVELKTIKIKYKSHKDEKYILDGRKPNVVFATLKEIFKEFDDGQEHCVMLALNSKLEITGWKLISQGGADCTVIDPRIVLRSAILLGAYGIILAHNHGKDVIPSKADFKQHNRIARACRIIGLYFVDWFIITENEYYSYKMKKVVKVNTK